MFVEEKLSEAWEFFNLRFFPKSNLHHNPADDTDDCDPQLDLIEF